MRKSLSVKTRERCSLISLPFEKNMEDTCLIIFLKKQEVKIFQIKMKYKGRSQDRYRSDFLRKLLNGLFFKTSSPTFKMIMTRQASFQNQCLMKGYILILFTN